MSQAGTKTRVNISVDTDMHREAKRRFPVLDLTFSGWVEDQLALFLQATDGMVPYLEAIEAGEADPAQVKAFLRSFLATSTSMLGAQLVELGKATQQIQQLVNEQEGDTHKK